MMELTDEPDAPAQDEETVEAARLHELVGLVHGEAARVAELGGSDSVDSGNFSGHFSGNFCPIELGTELQK